MYPDDTKEEKAVIRQQGSKPPIMAGDTMAARQSCKSLLLERAERMRREANQLENLAYHVEQIRGDAEDTLWRLLQGDFFRR